MRTTLMFFIILLGFAACKHKHEVSESLKKAHAIQLEALEISKEVKQHVEQNKSVDNNIKDRFNQWVKNMIEIEGVEHDHSNCNHDHSRPTYSITDEEMIQVQTTWKDSIIQIKNDI